MTIISFDHITNTDLLVGGGAVIFLIALVVGIVVSLRK
jgi:hypothetical protein